jgi:hypothetical protein
MNKEDNYYILAKRFRVSSMRKIAKLLQFENQNQSFKENEVG